ncbi:MAG: MATE family efflux transporter [Thermodesulfovibrionia bacterium]|nr:MATE family efflux transporter [Thermodesulfovibrionia bacterium]
MTERVETSDLTKGSTWDNIWRMSWPMLFVMFFNFLVGLTDIYVAGFLGPEIQAVVGFVGQLYFFVIVVANAISIGTVAILARSVGAGRFEDSLSTARQSLIFGGICAIVLTLPGFLLKDQIISLSGFSGNIREAAVKFFVIYIFALAPNYMVIISNAIFRAGGEVRLTLIAMFFVSLINIALNFLLVFGLGIGYIGIALATAISMFAGMAICFFLFKKSRWKDIFSGTWHVSSDLAKRIIKISWPTALIQISWNAGTIILYNILSRLQDVSITAMAALTNGLRIEAIIYLPVFALNMAASVLAGQNLGAGEPKRAEKIGWNISIAGVALVSLIALPIFIWAGEISSPLAKDANVLAETVRYLRITMLSEPFMAIGVILAGSLTGAGDTKGAMLCIVSTHWLIRLPLAYILAVVAGYGAIGVWIAMAVSILFQGIAMTMRFRNGRWKKIKP